MVCSFRTRLSQVGLVASLLVPATGMAATVDLGLWTAESYPAVNGFPTGNWNVAPGGASVTQTVNGQPTLFHSPFNVSGTDVRGRIRSGAGDDDFVGFALGFQPGDSSNAAASYLLVDWKQGNQFHNFPAPSTTPGTTAARGLAVSLVSGLPTADEFWGHTNFAQNANGGLQELARGATLGNTGWVTNREYEFRFVFLPNQLQVYVDGSLEIDLAGAFSDGRMAFYNFSQPNVTYSAFTVDAAVVPVPGAALLMATGLAGLWAGTRRRESKGAKQTS